MLVLILSWTETSRRRQGAGRGFGAVENGHFKITARPRGVHCDSNGRQTGGGHRRRRSPSSFLQRKRSSEWCDQNAPIGAFLPHATADLDPSRVGVAVKFSFAGPLRRGFGGHRWDGTERGGRAAPAAPSFVRIGRLAIFYFRVGGTLGPKSRRWPPQAESSRADPPRPTRTRILR